MNTFLLFTVTSVILILALAWITCWDALSTPKQVHEDEF